MDGIIFIARLGSSRLPKKHTITALDKSFIEWLVRRYALHFHREIAAKTIQLVLATSDEKENQQFEALLRGLPVKVFYGSLNNIPLRLLQCARSYDFDCLLSVDGDDILCSPEAARKVRDALQNKDCTASWAKTSGLALGMNVAGFKRPMLEKCEARIGGGTLETGWGRVFQGEECLSITMGDYESRADLRFTLDYEEDAQFFKSIIEGIGEKIIEYTDEQIIDFTIRSGLNNINGAVHNRYWENFNDQIRAENS